MSSGWAWAVVNLSGLPIPDAAARVRRGHESATRVAPGFVPGLRGRSLGWTGCGWSGAARWFRLV